MKVYVLEAGCYSERWIVGVFGSPEAAMEAWHPERAEDADPDDTYQWESSDDGERWVFGADYENHATIRLFDS